MTDDRSEYINNIWVCDADGSNHLQLTKGDKNSSNPAWSPDGKSVSYFSDKSGEYKLYIAPADGIGAVREIALPNTKHYYTPSWSPDGKRILYTDTDLKLWVFDVASGSGTLIHENVIGTGASAFAEIARLRAEAGHIRYEDRGVKPGETYQYRLVVTEDGRTSYLGAVTLRVPDGGDVLVATAGVGLAHWVTERVLVPGSAREARA